jgi:predicted transposase YbfD/YdcC
MKSNEITAIPKLLSLIDITGAMIILDAMDCQMKIAKQIKQHCGDYAFSLNGNQGNY